MYPVGVRSDMKQYKQKEVAKLEGVEVRTLQRWGNDELLTRGWTKHGDGNGCYYTREQDDEVEGVVTTRADLEIRKLKAEIAEKEQKLERKKRLMFQEWTDMYMSSFMESFAPMKDLLVSARFDEENTGKWNEVLDKCIAQFQKDSESIYLSVNISDQ